MKDGKWQMVWQDGSGYLLLRVQPTWESGNKRERPITIRRSYGLDTDRQMEMSLEAMQQLILAVGDELELDLAYLSKLLRDRKRQRALAAKKKDPLLSLVV